MTAVPTDDGDDVDDVAVAFRIGDQLPEPLQGLRGRGGRFAALHLLEQLVELVFELTVDRLLEHVGLGAGVVGRP